MKLQFDANQDYQAKALAAVVDLFDGQPLEQSEFRNEVGPALGQLFNGEYLIGNHLAIDDETVLGNLRAVQKQNGVEPSPTLEGLNFTVEMETGTGKTYVYLRTIYELHRKYGYKKFIIVVPSLAIKEGVLKNLQITEEHFATLFDNPKKNFFVYDSKRLVQVRNFARNDSLQIMVINIDSFVSDTKIINKKSESGIPIHQIQGTRPIVIVDEPQNMETELRRKAIENLHPLFTLRYSATHKNLYNLVYKLDPVAAYDLGLVKRIEVDSVLEEENANQPFVELVEIKSTSSTITAKLKIDVNEGEGIKRKEVTVKKTRKGPSECDLFVLSNEREVYRGDYVIDSVDVQGQSVTLANGVTLYAGHPVGTSDDQLRRYQIRLTIQNHLERELKLRPQGIKVLSLFFIDKVANYRDYSKGPEGNGPFADIFEEELTDLLCNPRYKGLLTDPVHQIHNGYFSQDNNHKWKDTGGAIKADNETYSLIMKRKEELLDLKNPLRFIFSHSALREGWDNPNVFQICTLNETRSEIKKRQEIGRGMRLAVNQQGERVFDEQVNVLTVIANESYQEFAKALQTEIEEDCGVEFTGRIKNKRNRQAIKAKKGYQTDENFLALWERVKFKTRYRVRYDSEELIKKAAKEIADLAISKPKLRAVKANVKVTKKGVKAIASPAQEKVLESDVQTVPDILGYIQEKTNLTKATIYQCLERSSKLPDLMINPQQFMDLAAQTINRVLRELMVDGIKYEKIAGETWEMRLFDNQELEGYLENLIRVKDQSKTLYDHIEIDGQSTPEKRFLEELEANPNVKFYLKLPRWFKIQTPIGAYNPDWAVYFEREKKFYFVAETKSTTQMHELGLEEQLKIKCGRKHYAEFEDVAFFGPVTSLGDIAL